MCLHIECMHVCIQCQCNFYSWLTKYILNFIMCCMYLGPNQDSKKLLHIWPNLSAWHISLWHLLAVAKRWQCFCSAFSWALFPFLLLGLEPEKTSCLTILHQHKSKFTSSPAPLSMGKDKLYCEHFILKENQCDQFRDKILSSCPIHTYLKSKKKAAFTFNLWCNPRIGQVIFTKEKI